MKPLICISAHKTSNQDYWTRHYYSEALQNAGAIPVLSVWNAAEDYADCCNALLIPGGGDVNPSFYGEENNGSKNISDDLDAQEKALFDAFLKRGKPIFGICRGCQFINAAMGGTLVQDIPSQIPLNEHQPVFAEDGSHIHSVSFRKGSFLEEMFGETILINSFHHQSVKDCGKGLKVIAQTSEGVVEAFQHETLPIYGIQWHPEQMHLVETLPSMAPLFSYFVSLCQN